MKEKRTNNIVLFVLFSPKNFLGSWVRQICFMGLFPIGQVNSTLKKSTKYPILLQNTLCLILKGLLLHTLSPAVLANGYQCYQVDLFTS